MKGSFTPIRYSRLSMAFLMLLNLQANPVWAAKNSEEENAGILPIETSINNRNLIDELFGGAGIGIIQNKNKKTKNIPGNNQENSTPEVLQSEVAEDFRCNLFENVPYNDILSAVNALNAAVSSPACASSENKVNVQGIVENNKAIASAVQDLRGFVENPDTIQAEHAADISNRVDVAIRAATSIANTFAQSGLLRKECRESMNAGQIATSINEVINGLTPYALMAATVTTGGTAAIPYIVGGSVITGAINSMSKIIEENGVKVEQADVRRAIVENTCQYIRLDQKYKFLIKSRQEQINKITADLNATHRLFSAKINGLASDANNLLNRKNALEKFNLELNSDLGASRGQLELDKQFIKSTSDDIKICQLGIQLANLSKDKNSYIAKMLSSLDQAMIAYGTSQVPQAQALKMSSSLARKTIENVASVQFSKEVNFKKCADATKSFIETIEQSASLSKQLVKMAQDNLEKGLQSNREYHLYKSRLSLFSQKQFQAQRVTESLDKLRAYANTITQSEIDAELLKVRRGLFSNSFLGLGSSPVLKWFEYVNGLHRAEVGRFQNGLQSLRIRAFLMTPSSKVPATAGPSRKAQQDQRAKDAADGKNLAVFNLKQLPLGTKEHSDVCRELQDVWGHWVSAVDHLAASDAFCNMLEPYIYDNRPEDQKLVEMCRGYSENSIQARYLRRPTLSKIASMKDSLVKNNLKSWALFIQGTINSLACINPGESMN